MPTRFALSPEVAAGNEVFAAPSQESFEQIRAGPLTAAKAKGRMESPAWFDPRSEYDSSIRQSNEAFEEATKERKA